MAENVQTLQLTQEHIDQLANNGGGSISFGPLTLSWNFSLNPLAIDLNATLLGVSIGHVTISPSNPTVTIGGSVGPFTAEVTLTLDTATMQINYHIVVKAIVTIIDKSGSINL